MITIRPTESTRPRAALAVSTTVLLCVILVGCSSGGTRAAGSANTQPSAAAGSSSGSVPPSSPTSSASLAVTTGAVLTASPASDTTACALVTEQEASTALGADPGAGQATVHLGASSCVYGTSPTLVTVNLVPTGGAAAYDHARRQAPSGQTINLTAVGDGAFGVFRGPAAEIWFHKGDAVVAIGVIHGGSPVPPKDQAVALAKLAIGRL